jgi:hypothetical protein
MTEYIKYNPLNYRPDLFMRPPTECVQNDIRYLIREMEEKARIVFEKKHAEILVGTELEVLFFSPRVDPVVAERELPNHLNPNYDDEHLLKLNEIEAWANTLMEKHPSQFLESDRMSRIFMEFRTMPQTCAKYLDTVDLFRTELGKKTRELNILPVVHSQHIHLSVTGTTNNRFGVREDFLAPIFKKYYHWEPSSDYAFIRLLPLVLLPEEWEDRNAYSCGAEQALDCINSERTMEARKLSSEYANDYVLNLLLSLKMLASVNDPRCNTGFPVIIGPDSYKSAARKMSEYKDLRKFFGESVITKLSSITEQYPAVSRRKITIEEVKR